MAIKEARELTTHRVNGLNEALRIFVLDKPGSGGACHDYAVLIPLKGDLPEDFDPDYESPSSYHFLDANLNPFALLFCGSIATIMSIEKKMDVEALGRAYRKLKEEGIFYTVQRISFQNGPVKEAGYNGNSQEALLAILIDRLEGFQKGQYASHDNQMALDHIQGARLWLHKRTMDRVSRGVEGTHQK